MDIHNTPDENASLEGLETVTQAENALLRACIKKPRALASSQMTGVELWFARGFTKTADIVLRKKANKIEQERGKSSFVRDFSFVETTKANKTIA